MLRFADLQEGQALPERRHRPGNAHLFLYNAAIWNAHRIHYDERYVTEVEGYPGVVIDGPLQGDWLAQVVTEWLDGTPRAALRTLSFSHRRAAYLGETLTAGGTVAALDAAAHEATLELFVRNEAGEVVTPGRALVRFGDGEGS